MQIRQILKRNRGPRVLDLSHETPTERARLKIETEPVGWWSSIGRAVVFLDGASEYSQRMRVDVDGLAQLLSTKGVPDSYLNSLAVVVHPREDNRGSRNMGVKVGGWHRANEEVHLESKADNESVVFTNALHVVGGGRDSNHTLLHEAWHLCASATGQEGKILYTDKNAQRLRRAGLATLVLSGGLEVANGFALAEGLHPAAGVAVGAIGGLGLLGGAVAGKFPKQILWLRSGEERDAERFAHEHASSKLISFDGGLLPNNHILAASSDISYWQKLTLGLKNPNAAPAPNPQPAVA